MSISRLGKTIARAHREGRLARAILNRVRHVGALAACTRYFVHNPAAGRVVIHCPSYVAPDPADGELVQRIFRAYRRMKEDQKTVSEYYLPSSMWQQQLDTAYTSFSVALKEEDIAKFHFFLANFGAWPIYTGIESSTLIRDNVGSPLRRFYLQNYIFLSPLKLWKWFHSGREPPLSRLTYPKHGNQSGAIINDCFVGPGSFFNEIYGSLLSNLVRGIDRPTVAELGGGYGKLAYFTLRDFPEFSFVDFDLPETVSIASYYLMKTFPDRKALLYGEADYSQSSHKDFDLIFMPAWVIDRVGAESFDLFINKNSLGEMTTSAVRNYISHIARSTKNYFFHMNHDSTRTMYDGGGSSLLGYEYPVPLDQFTLLIRYPDMGHMLFQNFIDFNSDIFIYIYGRTRRN
jgi:hypothetical protein